MFITPRKNSSTRPNEQRNLRDLKLARLKGLGYKFVRMAALQAVHGVIKIKMPHPFESLIVFNVMAICTPPHTQWTSS